MLLLDADDVRRAPAHPPGRRGHEAGLRRAERRLRRRPPPGRPARPSGVGVSLVMSSYVDAADRSDRALAVKVVSLFDGNPGRGLARVQATVLLLEADTGRLEALGRRRATAIRTAAASGAATDLLARPEAARGDPRGRGPGPLPCRGHLLGPGHRDGRGLRPDAIEGRGADPRVRGPGRHRGPVRRGAVRGGGDRGGRYLCTTTTSGSPVFRDPTSARAPTSTPSAPTAWRSPRSPPRRSSAPGRRRQPRGGVDRGGRPDPAAPSGPHRGRSSRRRTRRDRARPETGPHEPRRSPSSSRSASPCRTRPPPAWP